MSKTRMIKNIKASCIPILFSVFLFSSIGNATRFDRLTNRDSFNMLDALLPPNSNLNSTKKKKNKSLHNGNWNKNFAN